MEKERYAVDRIEGGLAVLVADRGGVADLHLLAAEYGLAVNDILDITSDGGAIISIRKRDDIRDERLASVESRLHNLFKRGKKQ